MHPFRSDAPDPRGDAPVPQRCARSAPVLPFSSDAPVLPSMRVVTGRAVHRTGASPGEGDRMHPERHTEAADAPAPQRCARSAVMHSFRAAMRPFCRRC
ncbi:MAG TPA: hypothetical protein VKZ83_13275, partial [Phototrophicaceae bacterium]|nr:hypothetical protein [Phototrophicaceae bacterium]